jgi:parallel beta-helix repeat protein
VTADGDGIFLYSSSNNTVSGNNATANSEYGMYLEDSSNNIVNGNNSTANGEYGICLDSSSNDAVSGNNVTANSSYGIYLLGGSSNIVSENNLAANAYGIYLWGSSNNTVSGNGVRANGDEGIVVRGSSNNIISGNDATANSRLGIYLLSSSNNTIYHNSFVGNGAQAAAYSVSGNAWDDGYPSGGNYWSDYNGTDLYSGPYQNVTGSDGIGDTPYVIDANDVDHFPLMGPFSDFSVAAGVDVQVVSNSTVSDFEFNGTAILFNVTGVNGTMGFCNVCIPTSLVNGTLAVFVNGTQVQYSLLPSSNSTISYLYFTYGQSTEEVIILPEFPDSLILAMFMLATLFSIAIHKKKHSLS